MSAPQIHRNKRAFCVSDALDTLGEDIALIRQEDGITWDDIGRVFNKHRDRARDYSKALSEMPLSAFLLGCREWNGRFADRVLAMIGMRLIALPEVDQTCDRKKASSITRANLAVSVMLEDNDISDEEIRVRREELIAGRDAFDALLSRIGPQGKAA